MLHPDEVTVEYTATATLTDHDWELHVDGVGMTRVLTLDEGERQVRAMIETAFGVTAPDAVSIRIVPA